MGNLGDIIKHARMRRNWDQAELARRVEGVRQQTVSGWERGSSRPRRAVVARLAEVLDLDVQALLVAAGYVSATADYPDEVQPPVRPRLTTLRLDELSPDRFEQFSADLAKALNHGAAVHRYGGQGHKQGGIDVIVEPAVGKPTGIQCKREKDFGPAKVKEAVAALTVDVRECIIFLTRVASPQARKEISKYKNWRLWDIEDISQAVRTLADRDAALRLVDTYFPQWREPFLGIAAPGPWLTPEEFFRPFSGDQVYTHDWPLVGRTMELEGMRRLLTAPETVAGTLVGRGGIGKSRLLRALSTEIGNTKEATVRFLATDTPIEPAHYELLPPDDRLIVIVDDAHGRTDNAAIIGGIRRIRPNAKVLLSLRPQGLGQLTADLRQVGLHPSDLPSWTLDDLQASEAQSLAQQIVGQEANPAIARRLATLAPDCPLLIVIGATLIKREQLDARLLESSDSIRMEILTRFSDALVADPTVGDPELRRDVLKAVAVLQPFRIGETVFRDAISSLTGKAFDQVMPHLNGLESAGIILRRGTSLRIVPDLLGDVILADAALDRLSGTQTGYLERVYQAATGEALQHAFVNASRVDWQIRQDKGRGTALVEPLWAQLNAEFQATAIWGRLALLKLLEKVAFFQPDPALALVRWAIANPTDVVEETDHPLVRLYQPDYSEVIRELPKVLEKAGYNLDHLSEVVDILWDLARNDGRSTNQHPYHPIRVLSELASYDIAKPRVFQEILISAAERWLEHADLSAWPYSPFEVLKPILETEAEIRRSDGLSVTLQSVSVKVEAVKDLREHILNLAFAEIQSQDLKRAIEAVKTIRSAIRYPSGAFGRSVTDEERDRWTPLFVETIERLGQSATEDGLDPAISVAIHQALQWHARYSSTETRSAAQPVLSRIPDSLGLSLAQVLHDSSGRDVAFSGDAEDFERRRQARLDEVAAAVTDRWSDEEVVDQITQRLSANQLAYGENSGQPVPFVWTLVENNPTIGDIICRRVIADPSHILRELVPVVLGRLAHACPPTALTRARELLATEDVLVQRCVAQAFGWSRGDRSTLVDGEADLLRYLARSQDPAIRRFVAAAAGRLSTFQRLLALELVTTIKFADSAHVAEDIASIFSSGHLSWADLSPMQADDFLSQIRDCPSIDGYQINVMLGEVSKSSPETVLELLKGRVEVYEQNTPHVNYEPLPHIWHKKLHFREAANFVDYLRLIIDWMAAGVDSWPRQREGAGIFAIVAEGFDDQVMQIIAEAVETGDRQRIQAVGSILHEAPEDLVWDNVDFAIRMLKTANKYGEECVQAIGAGFHAAAITGERVGTPGQPFHKDIEQRDKSMRIADALPLGSVERRFYQSLQASAENRIRWEGEHDRNFVDRRDW
ncbi:helix-turn-helix domain-containing protein [Nonomuraea dietziae]|uniref:helix-turn-helix domain-containing protein n=1 Tax=Nonomuraea dietziae TaxID=65515 RepID=UPI0033D87463